MKDNYTLQTNEKRKLTSDEMHVRQAFLFLYNKAPGVVNQIFKSECKKKPCLLSEIPHAIASLESMQTIIEFDGNPKYEGKQFFANRENGFEKKRFSTILTGESIQRFVDNYTYFKQNPK
jgi:hypothetical protein